MIGGGGGGGGGGYCKFGNFGEGFIFVKFRENKALGGKWRNHSVVY